MRGLRFRSLNLFAPLAIALLPTHLSADEMEEWTQSLRAAEISFATSVAEKNLDDFVAHLDDDAIFAAGQVLNGKAAIVEAWSGFFVEGGPRMEWHPETVVVRAGGRLGLSKGPYTLTIAGADGTETSQTGQFISIWERQEGGGWKILFDSGCPPCPECGAQ